MENYDYEGPCYFEIPISEFTKSSNFEQVIKLSFDVNTLKIPGTRIPKFNPDFSIRYAVANMSSWNKNYFGTQTFLFDYFSYGTTNRHDEECILIERLGFQGTSYYEIPISEFLKHGIFEGDENKSVYKKYTEEYCDNIVIAVSCGEEIQECDRLAGHRLHEQLYSGVKLADHICIVPYTKGYATKEFYENDGFEIINYMDFIKNFE